MQPEGFHGLHEVDAVLPYSSPDCTKSKFFIEKDPEMLNHKNL